MEFFEYPKYVYPNDVVDAATGVLVHDQAQEAAARKSFKKRPAPAPAATPEAPQE